MLEKVRLCSRFCAVDSIKLASHSATDCFVVDADHEAAHDERGDRAACRQWPSSLTGRAGGQSVFVAQVDLGGERHAWTLQDEPVRHDIIQCAEDNAAVGDAGHNRSGGRLRRELGPADIVVKAKGQVQADGSFGGHRRSSDWRCPVVRSQWVPRFIQA